MIRPIRPRTLAAPARLLALLAAVSALGLASPARADLVISAPDVVVTPGTSGFFDVLLQNVNPSPGTYTIGGFTVDLRLQSTSSVTFTSVAAPPASSYIFGSIATFGFVGTQAPGQVTGNDLTLAPNSGVPLAPGSAAVGLIRVGYQVAANAAPGSVTMQFFSGLNGTTGLSNAEGNPINLTASNLRNGSFRVVPEPSSLILAALGLSGCGVLAARMRSSRTA